MNVHLNFMIQIIDWQFNYENQLANNPIPYSIHENREYMMCSPTLTDFHNTEVPKRTDIILILTDPMGCPWLYYATYI